MNIDSPDIFESEPLSKPRVRLLLLDDEPTTLMLRGTILRKHGYDCIAVTTIDEAIEQFHQIDIAVLDYHLGAGKFGSDVAILLRRTRPEVPIIILSATLEHYFGGAEDMHLLKGYSSNETLLAALQSLDAKRRGAARVVDARHFFYSRICHTIGADVLIQIFNERGVWVYCNEAAADYLDRERDWFPGRSIQAEMPKTLRNWQTIVLDVLTRHEAYIDRSPQGLLRSTEPFATNLTWSLMAFPICLHDDRPGVVLTARVLPSTGSTSAS